MKCEWCGDNESVKAVVFGPNEQICLCPDCAKKAFKQIIMYKRVVSDSNIEMVKE